MATIRFNTKKSLLFSSEDEFQKSKHAVQISVVPKEDSGSEITTTSSLNEIRSITESAETRTHHPPIPSYFAKLEDYGRVVKLRAKGMVNKKQQPYHALSSQGKFQHHVVDPFSTWFGNNKRVVLGHCLSSVDVQELDGSSLRVVNGTSQNYVGFYQASPLSEELQRLALEQLPVADATSIPLLANEVKQNIAQHLRADFCELTSSGYGANYLALPTLADQNTAVLLDENCHNSMFTGLYLARPGLLKKFPHNDIDTLGALLREVEGKHQRILVVIEGMYSMEGDIPQMGDLWRLKKTFNYVLYCDEAHSFYSAGSSGRGCLEHWNEENPRDTVPENLIDVTTGTFSKAVGGVGGFVCGKSPFQKPIQVRAELLQEDGHGPLATSQMVQYLWVHNQPSRTRNRLRRLKEVSIFCRAELARFGIHVYGEDVTHILPIHTGGPTLAAKLSYRLRCHGLLAVPISAPAVPYWQSRVRLNLSAGHSDAEINTMLDAVIKSCRDIGTCRAANVAQRTFKSHYPTTSTHQEDIEASQAFKVISHLIAESARSLDANQLKHNLLEPAILQKGHESRANCGFGSGGSRWMLTLPSHNAVERLIAEQTGTQTCLTYPEAEIGLASTIAALSRPLLAFAKHYMLLPKCAPQAVSDGTVIASKRERPEEIFYNDLGHLLNLVQELSKTKGNKNLYMTIYLDVPSASSNDSIKSTVSALCKKKAISSGMTVLLHLPKILSIRGISDKILKAENVQLLFSGSFYQMFGLPGGYLAGSDILVEELRYTSRGYMFSTSCQPFIMDMVKASLKVVS